MSRLFELRASALNPLAVEPYPGLSGPLGSCYCECPEFDSLCMQKNVDDIEDVFDAVATVLGPDVPLADDTGTGEGEETEDPPLRTGQEEAEDSLAVLQM